MGNTFGHELKVFAQRHNLNDTLNKQKLTNGKSQDTWKHLLDELKLSSIRNITMDICKPLLFHSKMLNFYHVPKHLYTFKKECLLDSCRLCSPWHLFLASPMRRQGGVLAPVITQTIIIKPYLQGNMGHLIYQHTICHRIVDHGFSMRCQTRPRGVLLSPQWAIIVLVFMSEGC